MVIKKWHEGTVDVIELLCTELWWMNDITNVSKPTELNARVNFTVCKSLKNQLECRKDRTQIKIN